MHRGRRAETERATLAAEMVAARAVQEVLLPSAEGRLGSLSWRSLAIPCVGIAGDMLVAREVGDGLHAMLGDVSGKGARAGLVMAGTQACADTLADAGFGPAEIVSRLDDWAIRNTPPDMFVTLWCGRVEPDGLVRFVVAGHPHMYVRRADGRIERPELELRPVIGVIESESPETTLQLEPGDALVVYSDGLFEEFRTAGEHDREQFGEDRVMESIARHGPDPAAIHQDLVEWCGHHQLKDDLTILVVRRD
jgi:serine phosphatase RsbU (regulator of sigma subunit)